uniref:HNH endonuclease n=1 Tax=Pseudomonas veronii TaxID=76761 RepID=UPI0019012DEA|nr:HNH endonuclease [Pseudomonas veronii]
MWSDDVGCFAILHKISIKQARRLQCTAEHLTARQDGGKDEVSNIVAACVTCNGGRHKIKDVPDPDEYRMLVQKRLSAGKWHSMKFCTA